MADAYNVRKETLLDTHLFHLPDGQQQFVYPIYQLAQWQRLKNYIKCYASKNWNFALLLVLLGLRTTVKLDMNQSIINATQPIISLQKRLSQLKLRKFDVIYSELSRFISTFNTVVHNESQIPLIEKFNYLFNCLLGQALPLIESFQVIEKNYRKALYRLKQRYYNKILIFIDNINILVVNSTNI